MSAMRPLSGKITVVGIGPGSLEDLTPRAARAIEESQVVVGYRWYLELIGGLLEGKTVQAFGMGQEQERARAAADLAYQGYQVALVSGGDPGVYGMAGPLLEALLQRGWSRESGLPVEIVPGVTAATAGAALLGAPLMQDFAVISLSDRFGPWELIARRLEAAAASDMVVVLYEPASHLRPRHIEEAQRILLQHRTGETPVGVVRDAYRPGEQVVLTSLGQMLQHSFDMRTVVIVGNSSTKAQGGVMVTPRQYPS
ncbi:MAG: precorrin-3B C(17)-methyltransferase [Chloroflexi bacterium]|nr:precorrin-3B C(17)-methyltransferase [Chloroflexota bacterium]